MRLLPPILLIFAGCSSSNGLVANTDGTTESDSGADSVGHVATSTTGTVETGADETAVSAGEVPASGIELRTVITNQGVRIPVWDEDGWVSGGERNAPLVPGRRMLVRAGFELDEGFVPRLLEGRLHVVSDGNEEVLTATLDPTTDTDDAFEWLLEASSTTDGAEFYIDVIEVEPEIAPLPAPNEPTRLPGEGTALFGFQPIGPSAKVVGVPFRHVVDDCAQPFPVDEREEYGWWFKPRLLAMLPVVDVAVELHEPVETSATSFLGVFADLAAVRNADGEDAKTLYFGYVVPCPGTFGYTTTYDAGEAVGVASYDPDGRPPDMGDRGLLATYMVTHGLGNILCEAQTGPGPIDLNYPYPNGEIGVPGYDIYDLVDIPPDTTTIMSVDCGDGEWVSDYEWDKLYWNLSQ